MRRATIPFLAAAVVLAVAPASALARHHHHRHHSRAVHARIKRFGRDVATNSSGAASAENAGTVQSFSNGILTIALSNGNTVSGTVGRDTEIECMSSAGSQMLHEDGDAGSGSQSGDGDDSGSADNEAQGPGGDQGGDQGDDPAEDQGDDQGEEQGADQAENACSTANLIPGALVRDAELRISGSGSAWKKVGLAS
jgi:hypothetical protein